MLPVNRSPFIRQFCEQAFESYDPRFVREAIAPIQNQVGSLRQSLIARNILGQVRTRISIQRTMNESRIFIDKLSKGRMGHDQSPPRGALLVAQFQFAAMARANQPEEERRDFHLFIDEFQNFSTDSFASIVAEARKYRLCLSLSHQYLDQLPLPVRQAVFGNVGNPISFRVGNAAADALAAEFGGDFQARVFSNLPKHQAIVRLHVEGYPREPERASALAPLEIHCGTPQRLICRSRERFTLCRQQVEAKSVKWMSGKH